MKERWAIALMGLIAAIALVLAKTAGPGLQPTHLQIQTDAPPPPLQLHAARAVTSN